jgi:NitT/TauT family transport system ATP-binding protein
LNVLELVDIGHAYGQQPVLERLSLSIAGGEMVALVGPSGCGKTTLAHIAAGILQPSQGWVRRAYRRHGMIFQEPRLLPWASAKVNIGFPLQLAGMSRREANSHAERIAATVALQPEHLSQLPDALSGGMRQRVAIARALVVDPDLLLCDEPFTALDVTLRRRMQDVLLEATQARRFSSLFITHDLSEAVRMAQRIAVMDQSGQGILGERTPPGRIGQRSAAEIFEFVQYCLHDGPLFSAAGMGGS